MNTAMQDWKEIGGLRARVAKLEAALRTIIEFSEKFGVSQQTAVVINHARFLLPTISPLCAICDLIPEMHRGLTHEWTAKETATPSGGTEHGCG